MLSNLLPLDIEWPDPRDPVTRMVAVAPGEPYQPRETKQLGSRSIPDRLLAALSWLVQAYLESCIAYALVMYPTIVTREEFADMPIDGSGKGKQPEDRGWSENAALQASLPQARVTLRRPPFEHRWRPELGVRQSRPAINVHLPTSDIFEKLDRRDRSERFAE